MENQFDTTENQIDTSENESENIIPQTSSNKTKTWIYRSACILFFAAGAAYFLLLLIKSQYIITLHYPILYNTAIIKISIIAAMVTVLVCFLRSLKKIPVFKFAALIIAGGLLAASWYIYFRYFPKSGYADACAIVKADPKYASATIEPHYRLYSDVKDNPFCRAGYILNVVSDGKVTEWIEFDSTTGKFESCEPEF